MNKRTNGLKRYEQILKDVTGLNPKMMPEGNIGRAYLSADVCQAILAEFPEVTSVVCCCFDDPMSLFLGHDTKGLMSVCTFPPQKLLKTQIPIE